MSHAISDQNNARLLEILERLRELHAEQLVLVTEAIQETRRQVAVGKAPTAVVVSLCEKVAGCGTTARGPRRRA